MQNLLAALALAYLLIMAFPGLIHHSAEHHRHEHQHSAHGLFTQASSTINALELVVFKQSFRVKKKNNIWHFDSRALTTESNRLIEELTNTLAASEPVRTFQPEDLTAVAQQDYGFEASSQGLIVGAADDSDLALDFGYATPDGNLRYVRVRGDPALYVMSGFMFSQFSALVTALQAFKE